MSSKSELHHINFYNLPDRNISLTSLSAALSRALALRHLTSVLAGVFLCMAGHGIHISYFTQFVISFPSHFILLTVWFSLFSSICCPLDYKMKMHNRNIEFRQTLSVWFSHSFNISRSLSLSVKYGCWQSLCCSEDTHRDRSGFLSLAMMWKQVSVCVWEKNTQTDVCTDSVVLVVMLSCF